MLERLSFKNIGPGFTDALEFGERMNLLTGDNGLGKTFILDAAWWALTRTWADGKQLEPPVRATEQPKISYVIQGVAGATREITCDYDLSIGRWNIRQGRPPIPGLVVYARVDGGFSVWDPARNYWRESDESPEEDRQRPSSFQFTRRQVWNGLWRSEDSEEKRLSRDLLCRGLIEDLVTWWQQNGTERKLFTDVLNCLSPNEPLELSDPVSTGRGLFKVPTLKVSYSKEPIRLTEASSGVRRIFSLTYMLVWSWLTHREEVGTFPSRATPAKRLILLFDEIETHLHPEWQRRILPGLLAALESQLFVDAPLPVQIIGTTHAPLVLASVETRFNPAIDRLFNLEVENGRVELEDVPWAKHGDVASWLESEAFDMQSDYSLEAELAIQEANAFLSGTGPQDTATRQGIEVRLRNALGGDAPFLVEWFAKTQPEVLKCAAQARKDRLE